MSTTAERPQLSEEHREVLERAKSAIYDGESVIEELRYLEMSFAPTLEAADVTLLLEQRVAAPDAESGPGGIDRETFLKISPMRRGFAQAIWEHNRQLKKLDERLDRRWCELERALIDAIRQLVGYDDSVDFPVLNALKELDLATETEEEQ